MFPPVQWLLDGITAAVLFALLGFRGPLLLLGQFGLTARKAPQLATVALADGATNEVPALAVLGLDGLATLI